MKKVFFCFIVFFVGCAANNSSDLFLVFYKGFDEIQVPIASNWIFENIKKDHKANLVSEKEFTNFIKPLNNNLNNSKHDYFLKMGRINLKENIFTLIFYRSHEDLAELGNDSTELLMVNYTNDGTPKSMKIIGGDYNGGSDKIESIIEKDRIITSYINFVELDSVKREEKYIKTTFNMQIDDLGVLSNSNDKSESIFFVNLDSLSKE